MKVKAIGCCHAFSYALTLYIAMESIVNSWGLWFKIARKLVEDDDKNH
jgi:hypothetical protein